MCRTSCFARSLGVRDDMGASSRSVGQALRDLLCDTVHLAHRLGLRPENLFQSALSAAAEEEAEDGGRVRSNPSLEDQKP
jgi:hypothetical protein